MFGFTQTGADIAKDLHQLSVKLQKTKKLKNNFAVAYVNAEYAENQDLVQEYQIQGFPTIYLLNPKQKIRF